MSPALLANQSPGPFGPFLDKVPLPMFRVRCMSSMMACGLLIVCGCCFSLPERPWFGRHRDAGNGDFVVSGGGTVVTEGPILSDAGPPTCSGPPGTVLNAPAPTNAP